MYRPSIDLAIDSEALDKFCKQLIKRSRNKEKTLDCLVTLEAFISLFSKNSQGSDEFNGIIATVQQHSDKSRQQLLSEKAALLVDALRALDIEAITDIYLPLSRNGFYEILQTLVSRFSELEISIFAEWAQQWIGYSKQRAAMASDYPDAPDFGKAGISLQQYQAMTDLERFLSSVNPPRATTAFPRTSPAPWPGRAGRA
jgi:hypothetical protein